MADLESTGEKSRTSQRTRRGNVVNSSNGNGEKSKSKRNVSSSAISSKASSWDRDQVIRDYTIARQSREASLLGRKEVLTGKAKFGIFGDGKEIAQLAMAHVFKPGDTRSGYYRDQTVMLALGITTIREFFAQLYANTDVEADPASAGRQMNGHFANRQLNPDGSWKNQKEMYNTSADVSPTGSQMPRLVGLAYASRLYRELDELKEWEDYGKFSDNGNEVAFGTIGNASAAEGMFFEAVNAIGVLKSPAVISVWDDGYGISVPNEFQMTKGSVSEVLRGLQRKEGDQSGYDVYVVKGWDYPTLVETYQKATETARREHVPAFVHVVEMTQPQGHSTSGSHERYKSPERLQWELDFDPLTRMRDWMTSEKLATAEELDVIDQDAVEFVRAEQSAAWEEYLQPIESEVGQVLEIVDAMAAQSSSASEIKKVADELRNTRGAVYRADVMKTVSRALIAARGESAAVREPLIAFKSAYQERSRERFSSHLYSESQWSALRVQEVKPEYEANPERLKGFEILNHCFDAALKRDPRIIAFGEDVGKLGDVDQGFAGLQAKHGELRVSDTGIREVTIVGQAIGMAMRGLRPIAEIQYLDYLLYALQIMSDDLATVQYRTRGGQKAPAIIRTRGHRLEGIWHSGSPMAGIINLVRGMHVLVPRNMTQAAAFYNTLLQSDEPALLVEVLSGYRSREPLPNNIDKITLPLGLPEVIRQGSDVTIVTYGACCRFADEAADLLAGVGISVEIVDVQSLLPFDLHGIIVESLKKTNRILFLDEDVPGGTTAYMMQKVLEEQGGWRWLDSDPKTLTAQEHRPAYGTDGSYWSKPFAEHIFESVYSMMNEADPKKYPTFF
ncbi:MAG: transketolase [Ignavibacteriae bacterium]|nr:transketolase [Ignavibacteriota bacterium]MCB9215863.1 transketolase [Ignavibacteria bacterium]